jgi:hypothetical protein
MISNNLTNFYNSSPHNHQVLKTHDFKKLGDNYLKLRERCNEIMNKIDWKDIINPKQ